MKRTIKKAVVLFFESQAKRLLRKHKPRIVAVAGSVGKTSTKLAIARVLAEKYEVLAHESSYNSDIGLPLSMFNLHVPDRIMNPFGWAWLLFRIFTKYRLRYPYQVVVLELGTDQPGDIGYFMKYVHPEVGVITAVTPEHMEGFASMDAVLDEEFQLADHSKKILLNAGDLLLTLRQKDLPAKSVSTFGVSKGDYKFEVAEASLGKTTGNLLLKNKKWFETTVFITGNHGLNAITAAAGVGEQMGLSPLQIKAGVEKIRPVHGRMNVLHGKNNSFIIDDSYNSSPDAAIAALDTLMRLPAKRRLAVLGSMNELGAYSKEAHQNVGRWCGKLDFLVVVGDEAKKHLIPAAVEAGLERRKIKSFISPYKAGRFLVKQIKSGDLILAKGSQNKIYVEETVKFLLERPSDQMELVRQSEFWQKRKAKQFKVQ